MRPTRNPRSTRSRRWRRRSAARRWRSCASRGPKAAGSSRAVDARTAREARARGIRTSSRSWTAAAEVIDRGLATFFAAPASSTGEDAAELSIHGSPVVAGRMLAALVAAGARPARPGEFTERAFLLGKIDLVEAEAVRDLIEARTEAAARALGPAAGGAALAAAGERCARTCSPRRRASPRRSILPRTSGRGGPAGDAVAARSGRARRSRAWPPATRPAGFSRRAAASRFSAAPTPESPRSSTRSSARARAIVTDVPGTTRDTLRRDGRRPRHSRGAGGHGRPAGDRGRRREDRRRCARGRRERRRTWCSTSSTPPSDGARRTRAALARFDGSAGAHRRQQDRQACRTPAGRRSRRRDAALRPLPRGGKEAPRAARGAARPRRLDRRRLGGPRVPAPAGSRRAGARGSRRDARPRSRRGESPEYAGDPSATPRIDAARRRRRRDHRPKTCLRRIFSTFCIGK